MADSVKFDVEKHLRTYFEEELKSAEKYCDMADAAKRMNRPDLYKGLREMAADEYTHAEFIKSVIESDPSYGTISSDDENMVRKLCDRIEGLFW